MNSMIAHDIDKNANKEQKGCKYLPELKLDLRIIATILSPESKLF